MIHSKRAVQWTALLQYLCLYCDDSKTFQYGEDQNRDNAQRCDIFDHDQEQWFPVEFSGTFYFIYNDVRLDHISGKDTGQECRNRHQDAVAQEIKEIQNTESDDRNAA